MNILERIIAEPTHRQRNNDFKRLPIADFSVEQTGATSPGLSCNTEHVIYLKIGVNFWANKAEYNTAFEIARKNLLQTIHQDILGVSDSLRSAIFSGDAKEALDYVDQLNEILGLK